MDFVKSFTGDNNQDQSKDKTRTRTSKANRSSDPTSKLVEDSWVAWVTSSILLRAVDGKVRRMKTC